MKEYFCDLCKRRIAPSDIRKSFKIEEDDITEEVDMHASCYYVFTTQIKKFLDDLNEEDEIGGGDDLKWAP